jgi:hypothetical protein
VIADDLRNTGELCNRLNPDFVFVDAIAYQIRGSKGMPRSSC